MTNANRKGKIAERDACQALNAALGCQAKRGQQRSGREGADVIDALPGGHCEVKRRARIAALRFLEQADRDAGVGELPFVVMREDGDREWVLMLRLSHAAEFARRVLSIGGHG